MFGSNNSFDIRDIVSWSVVDDQQTDFMLEPIGTSHVLHTIYVCWYFKFYVIHGGSAGDCWICLIDSRHMFMSMGRKYSNNLWPATCTWGCEIQCCGSSHGKLWNRLFIHKTDGDWYNKCEKSRTNGMRQNFKLNTTDESDVWVTLCFRMGLRLLYSTPNDHRPCMPHGTIFLDLSAFAPFVVRDQRPSPLESYIASAANFEHWFWALFCFIFFAWSSIFFHPLLRYVRWFWGTWVGGGRGAERLKFTNLPNRCHVYMVLLD